MYEIEVKGLASGHVVKKLSFVESQLDLILMDFLRDNGLPIASSCIGKGQCKKCVINKDMLSCCITLRELFKIKMQPIDALSIRLKITITIDYL